MLHPGWNRIVDLSYFILQCQAGPKFGHNCYWPTAGWVGGYRVDKSLLKTNEFE